MDKRKSTRFQNLLLDYSHELDMNVRKRIEETLWKEYGTEYAVFILDMSGFSLLTRKYGIVHYLSMVRRMQLTSEPIIESFSGSLIKYEADNCFAVFPEPLSAIRAAISLQLAFEASNILTTEDFDIHITCAVDYGKILVVGNEECWGDAVNRACKLGEDIGKANEILVTKDAMDLIPTGADLKCKPLEISVSGINISAYAIQYREPGV
ncbi:MAG: adenylate/guanylate cyclase domain-containing protein [Chloroflexota bacterium]